MVELIIILTVFFVFSFVYYLSYPKEISLYHKFDLFFLFIIFGFTFSRLIGIISSTEAFDVGWSIYPFAESLDDILVFGQWPWLFFRFWDGYIDYNYIFLTLIFSLSIIHTLNKKLASTRLDNYTSLSVSILIAYLFYWLLVFILKLDMPVRSISIFGMEPLLSQIIMGIFILIVAILVKLFDKKFPVFVLIYVFWGLLSIIARLISLQYEPVFGDIDLYYVEGIVCIVVAVFYILVFVMKLNKKSLGRANIKDRYKLVDSDIRIEKNKRNGILSRIRTRRGR